MRADAPTFFVFSNTISLRTRAVNAFLTYLHGIFCPKRAYSARSRPHYAQYERYGEEVRSMENCKNQNQNRNQNQNQQQETNKQNKQNKQNQQNQNQK